MEAISHSDNSPGVTTVRDGKGRPIRVADAVGTHTYTYTGDDRVLNRTVAPALAGATVDPVALW